MSRSHATTSLKIVDVTSALIEQVDDECPELGNQIMPSLFSLLSLLEMLVCLYLPKYWGRRTIAITLSCWPANLIDILDWQF